MRLRFCRVSFRRRTGRHVWGLKTQKTCFRCHKTSLRKKIRSKKTVKKHPAKFPTFPHEIVFFFPVEHQKLTETFPMIGVCQSLQEQPGEVFQCFAAPLRCPGGTPGTCAFGRDVTSVACSACLEGLQPLDSSGECGECSSRAFEVIEIRS